MKKHRIKFKSRESKNSKLKNNEIDISQYNCSNSLMFTTHYTSMLCRPDLEKIYRIRKSYEKQNSRRFGDMLWTYDDLSYIDKGLYPDFSSNILYSFFKGFIPSCDDLDNYICNNENYFSGLVQSGLSKSMLEEYFGSYALSFDRLREGLRYFLIDKETGSYKMSFQCDGTEIPDLYWTDDFYYFNENILQEVMKKSDPNRNGNSPLVDHSNSVAFISSALYLSLLYEKGTTIEYFTESQKNLLHQIQIPEQSAFLCYVAGSVHDIGQIFFPVKTRAHLMSREIIYSDLDYLMMKEHPMLGGMLYLFAGGPMPITKMILQHDEDWSGKGYPLNLKGTQIDLMAQCIRIADVMHSILFDESRRYIYKKFPGVKQAAITETEVCMGLMKNMLIEKEAVYPGLQNVIERFLKLIALCSIEIPEFKYMYFKPDRLDRLYKIAKKSGEKFDMHVGFRKFICSNGFLNDIRPSSVNVSEQDFGLALQRYTYTNGCDKLHST